MHRLCVCVCVQRRAKSVCSTRKLLASRCYVDICMGLMVSLFSVLERGAVRMHNTHTNTPTAHRA